MDADPEGKPPQLAAVLVLLIAVLASLLFGASTAHMCRPTLLGTPDVIRTTGLPLEITAFSCDTDGSEYYRHFDCHLSWTGGNEPDQVQISSGRRTNHYDENYVTLQGTCRGVNNPYVSVTVFDSGGHRTDAYRSAFY